MKTYNISKEELKDKKVLAEGYKIFSHGFKTKHGDYCYADENGNVVGTIHRVDGDIEECKWGLHFSKNPFNCFNFYEYVQWNEFAKVRAYEKIIDEILLQDQEENQNIYEIMKLIGKKRGAIISGGNIDDKKASRIILDDFRSGKLGKITLEKL